MTDNTATNEAPRPENTPTAESKLADYLALLEPTLAKRFMLAASSNERDTPRTAGALPSSRTEGQLAAALESNDIEAVKSQLQHVWSHYQALEFAVHGAMFSVEDVDRILNDNPGLGLEAIDRGKLVAAYIANTALDYAYQAAHSIVGDITVGGMTVPDALRATPNFRELDHSDSGLTGDAAIQAFLAQLLAGVAGDEADADDEEFTAAEAAAVEAALNHDAGDEGAAIESAAQAPEEDAK